MTGTYQPTFISDFVDSEGIFEENNDNINADLSREGGNTAESSLSFLGDLLEQNVVATTSQTIEFCNEGTGRENRQLHVSLIRKMGEEVFSQLVDQVDLTLSEQLERYIVNDIQKQRSDLSSPRLVISHFLSQAAKSNSQYLCGNCIRSGNIMPFHYHSYTVKRFPQQSMRWHARKLIDFIKQSSIGIDELTDHRLREVGVGVWGSSASFVVTLTL